MPRATLAALAVLAGCYGAHRHEALTALDLVAVSAETVVSIGEAQDIRPEVVPTNGCLPLDYYVEARGANYLIRATATGCEWIAWDDKGHEVARGVAPIAAR